MLKLYIILSFSFSIGPCVGIEAPPCYSPVLVRKSDQKLFFSRSQGRAFDLLEKGHDVYEISFWKGRELFHVRKMIRKVRYGSVGEDVDIEKASGK